MDILKHRLIFILVFMSLLSTYSCTSVPKLQRETPTELIDTYFQRWNAGIEDGGSGINVFIKINDKSIQLDSLYFRDKVTKLIIGSQNEDLYIGRFTSNDKKVEIPFNLGNKDCVVSYISQDKIFYFKISKLKEKEVLNYPSSPANN